MTRIVFPLLAILLTGCAHGLVGQLPVVDARTAATVTVIREWYFVAGGGPLTIALDGQDLVAMRVNEHFTFAVPPSEHTIRVKPGGDRREYFAAEPGRTYYFEVRPSLDWAGPSVNRIAESMAIQIMKGTTAMPMKAAD